MKKESTDEEVVSEYGSNVSIDTEMNLFALNILFPSTVKK